MTSINDRNINQWIERFLAGETDCREEKELYDFFKRPQLPEGLEKYRAMFGWYSNLGDIAPDSLEPWATAEPTAEAPAESPQPKESKVRLLHMRSWQWVSVAAMLALLLSVGFIFKSPSAIDVPEENMAYEGSYIIRDGKKITDLRIVVPEIIRNEKMVDDQLRAIDTSIEEADEAYNKAMTEGYDLSDPTVKEIVEAALYY